LSLELFHDIGEVNDGSGEPIQFGDHEDIAIPNKVHSTLQLKGGSWWIFLKPFHEIPDNNPQDVQVEDPVSVQPY